MRPKRPEPSEKPRVRVVSGRWVAAVPITTPMAQQARQTSNAGITSVFAPHRGRPVIRGGRVFASAHFLGGLGGRLREAGDGHLASKDFRLAALMSPDDSSLRWRLSRSMSATRQKRSRVSMLVGVREDRADGGGDHLGVTPGHPHVWQTRADSFSRSRQMLWSQNPVKKYEIYSVRAAGASICGTV